MNFDSETIEVRENGVAFLSYGPWRTSLLQGVTLRSLRGRAGRPFDMNRQSAHSRNGPAENWKTFAGSIAGGRYLVVGMEQVHSNVIRSVSPSAENCRCHDIRIMTAACDGLVTNREDVLLTATVADCVPVFMHDRRLDVIGLIHAGWRGTCGSIIVAGIDLMVEEYGSDVEDVHVHLGPSIEGACYPVGKEVFDRFTRWISPEGMQSGKWRVDLRGVNARQAMDRGVPLRNISISIYCTYCSTDLFYSHRRSVEEVGQRRISGRMVAFLGLRKQISP